MRPPEIAVGISCGWILRLCIYKHLVVEVTVTSARTNSNVPAVGASFPLRGSLVMGAQHVKIDVDLRNSSSLGTPSIQSVHDYTLEDGGRLAPIAVDLVDRLAILVVVRRFPSMGAADSRFLRSKSYAARIEEFVPLYGALHLFPSVDFFGMCVVGSCNALLCFFMARWVPISVMHCRRVVKLLLPASLLRGVRLMCLFFSSFLVVDSTTFVVLLFNFL
jgi:hypothetical protein